METKTKNKGKITETLADGEAKDFFNKQTKKGKAVIVFRGVLDDSDKGIVKTAYDNPIKAVKAAEKIANEGDFTVRRLYIYDKTQRAVASISILGGNSWGEFGAEKEKAFMFEPFAD